MMQTCSPATRLPLLTFCMQVDEEEIEVKSQTGPSVQFRRASVEFNRAGSGYNIAKVQDTPPDVPVIEGDDDIVTLYVTPKPPAAVSAAASGVATAAASSFFGSTAMSGDATAAVVAASSFFTSSPEARAALGLATDGSAKSVTAADSSAKSVIAADSSAKSATAAADSAPISTEQPTSAAATSVAAEVVTEQQRPTSAAAANGPALTGSAALLAQIRAQRANTSSRPSSAVQARKVRVQTWVRTVVLKLFCNAICFMQYVASSNLPGHIIHAALSWCVFGSNLLCPCQWHVRRV